MPASSTAAGLTSRPSAWWTAAVVLGTTAGYVLAFLALYPRLGVTGSSFLSVAPVLIAGWWGGLRVGAAVGVAISALTVVLFGVAAGAGNGPAVLPGGGAGFPILLAIGATVGRLRDLQDRLGDELRRRGTLLRVARRMAAETDANRVLEALLEEAAEATGADTGAIFRWDGTDRRLDALRSIPPSVGALPVVPPGQGVVWRAATGRAPVVGDGGRDSDPVADLPRPLQASAAVPLVEEGRLLGVLWLASARTGWTFSKADVELMELLAGAAVATLVALERARLAGVLLAARTAQHLVNNELALTVGYAELLTRNPDLPPLLGELAAEALAGARSATEILQQLGGIIALHETNWGPDAGTTIDLARSRGRAGCPSGEPG
jgi:hypothetical protein